jgi:hypothetical protein
VLSKSREDKGLNLKKNITGECNLRKKDRNCIIGHIQGSISFVLIVINQENSDSRLIGTKSSSY